MRDRKNGGDVDDDVTVTIDAQRCGEIIFTRLATLNTMGAAAPNDVTTWFRIILDRIIEFGDANDNGRLDDGDTIRSTYDLTTAICEYKRSQVILDGQPCDTVTVYDTAGVITFTFTVCSSRLSIGARTVPSRSAFEILEIHYSFAARDSKLALIFDAYTKDVTNSFVWNPPYLTVTNARTGFDLGSYKFDLNARTGDNDQIPLNFDLSPLAVLNAHPLMGETRAARLLVSVDAFSPGYLIIDPEMGAGNGPALSGATHVGVSPIVLLFALLFSALLAFLRL
jgi:hypothetical protein